MERNSSDQSGLDLAPQTLGQKMAQWIDDPVGSVMVGTIFPTAAVGVVVGGIASLALVF